MSKMEKRMLSPKEIAQATINSGYIKATKPIWPLFLLAILAGGYIAFGAIGYTIMSATIVDKGLAKLIGAAVFPVGLMLVIMGGAELFTGNCLMTLGYVDGKYRFKGILRNWSIVYIGNFIGSVLVAVMISKSALFSGAVADKAMAISTGKVSLSLSQAILRAVLCNILVVLSVWIATGAKDIVGKIFACWFPVTLFVLSGYEHSVANMYFIPLGKFLGANITWTEMWFNNLIPVTIGNIIGGAVIIPLMYYEIYVKGEKKCVQTAE